MSLDRGIDGGELVRRHGPEVVRRLGRLVDAPVALEEDRHPARCRGAFAAAQLHGDQRAGGRDHGLDPARRHGHGEERERGDGRDERATVHGRPTIRDADRFPRRYPHPMPVLRSRLDPNAPETRANHDAMAALVDDLRARQAAVAGRGAGGDDRSIERHRERGKLPVRERIDRLIDPGTAFLELSPLAATGLYDDDAPGRRDRHRHRPDRGHDLRGRRQRRDGQGRHLLPDDRQEAPAGPGDRAREPAAVPLPRRQRRRVPPAPGRRLPGPRPLRPHLLQPGPDVRGRDPAGRPGDGQVHRPAAPTSRR